MLSVCRACAEVPREEVVICAILRRVPRSESHTERWVGVDNTQTNPIAVILADIKNQCRTIKPRSLRYTYTNY